MSIPGLDSLSSETTSSPPAVANSSTATVEISPNETTNDNQTSDIDQTPLAEPAPPAQKSSKLCGVCHEQEGKYKCSRCYLPYCSVTCSKQHNLTHPANEPRRASPTPAPDPEIQAANPRLGTREAAGYRGPFAVLDESAELRELFAQFPNLPRQLEQINQATMRPEGAEQGGGFGARKDGGGGGWNQDKGWQKGVDALKRARGVYGKDGEGVREYGRLVLQLLSRDGQEDAKLAIRKEFDDESTQIIRQLLEMER